MVFTLMVKGFSRLSAVQGGENCSTMASSSGTTPSLPGRELRSAVTHPCFADANNSGYSSWSSLLVRVQNKSNMSCGEKLMTKRAHWPNDRASYVLHFLRSVTLTIDLV